MNKMENADKYIIKTTKAKIAESDILSIINKGEEILKPKIEARETIGKLGNHWTKKKFVVGDLSIKANKAMQVVLASDGEYQYSYLELNEGETFSFSNDGEEETAMPITSVKVRCDVGTTIDLLVTYL